jgi:hypothetical protein
VVGDQPAQHGTGVPDVAQVPGAVEGVQARHGEVGRVADVVQPCGGFQQIGVGAEDWCQAACPGGDALDVRPAAGEVLLEKFPGQLLRPWCQRVLRPRLDSRRGTFTGGAGRPKASCSAAVPLSGSSAVRSEADPVPSGTSVAFRHYRRDH